MKKIALSEIRSIAEFMRTRESERRGIIDLKRHRRVAVGPDITFVFENRDTMLWQIHEMCRVEKIVEPSKVAQEVETYNALVPGASELSTTMLVEFTDQARIKADLERLRGIEGHVALWVGRERTAAIFEAGHARDQGISAVQYVRFSLEASARDAFLAGCEPVRLVIEHPAYRAEAIFTAATRAALVQDLWAGE